MDRSFVVEHDLVARYLRGELAKPESEEFEAFFLDDEETLEEVELMSVLWASGETIKAPAVELGSYPDSQSVVPITNGSMDGNVSGQTVRPNQWHLPLASAASLAIGVLVGTVLVSSGPSVPSSGSLALLDVATLRSSDVSEITVPITANYAAFRVAIGAQDGPVDLILERSGTTVARVNDLITDGYGDVTVVVPTSQLTLGTYRISAIRSGTDSIAFDTTVQLIGD